MTMQYPVMLIEIRDAEGVLLHAFRTNGEVPPEFHVVGTQIFKNAAQMNIYVIDDRDRD